MRSLILLLGVLLFGCAAEMADEEEQEIGLQTDALVNGCYGHVVIKPTVAPGLSLLSWYNGGVWSLTQSGTDCRYQAGHHEFIYSQPTTSCARYSERVWYCGSLGVVECPASIGLNRPHQTSDSLNGPWGAFGRYHQSFHGDVRLPYFTSRFENGRLACIYSTTGQTYRYVRGM